jgi:hypothetical protein
MKTSVIAFAALLSVASAAAATPQCGLFKENNGHVTVIQAGTTFNQKDIEAKGGFSSNGAGPNGWFGCWVQVGNDPGIRSTKMYSMRQVNPAGAVFEKSPAGIQEGGFGSFFVPAYTKPSGKWSIEFFLVDRTTMAKQSIGATAFDMLDSGGPGSNPPPSQPSADAGVPGRVWRVTEGDPSWRGVWTRQGNSNTFDVVNTRTYGSEVQRFTVTMEVIGNQVKINRAGMFYNGTLSADRKSASGTATWYHPGTSWTAAIE